jgi:hypothetical protein
MTEMVMDTTSNGVLDAGRAETVTSGSWAHISLYSNTSIEYMYSFEYGRSKEYTLHYLLHSYTDQANQGQ